jgi:type IV secretion system protein VirB9
MMKNQLLVMAMSVGLAACAARPVPDVPLSDAMPATRLPEPAKPIEVVEVPKVLPLPGQLKPLPATQNSSRELADPKERVSLATAAARVEPALENYVNATQLWPFSPDALYQVYASPERITDIALEPGEELVSVSAGDTVRWVIGDTTSGQGAEQRVHVLVKPVRAELKTNLVIQSTRRSYHLELTATEDTWMAAVAWRYPLDRLVQLKAQSARAESGSAVADGVALERLNFRYEITGDTPAWRPLRAFDDGEKVYIQFPAGIGRGELPPLFIVGTGGAAELVNYRVHAPYYVVDRLFSAAELRLGGTDQQTVRIERSRPGLHPLAADQSR